MIRARRFLLPAAALLILLAGLVAAAWRLNPDPLDDARAFLAPYDELAWTPDVNPPGADPTGVVRLSRRTPLAAEEARMPRLLSSRVWTVRRIGRGLTASADRGSLLRDLVRRAPFLKSIVRVPTDWYVVELSGDATSTRATLRYHGRPYPFRTIPVTNR